ncbi:hypothetical protein BWI97_06125 [Siphonobacter sp. BAB-5405]|uniref:hypothetical protein n=1 Tax=Siphonobacter sp. BAB-5405 TaxID=1864825 RepID=UPI000C806F3C|nr:hypothetical protein [Siphonobacter sp. BAB-5405]PMD98257.1 hypothetical protein BWI97_06125 [Siphonobacter sp. BAB-5405]
MKKRLLTLLWLAVTHVLFAQDSTQVAYTVDIDTTSAPKHRLLDTYGDVFQTQVPARGIFKVIVPLGTAKTALDPQMIVPKGFNNTFQERVGLVRIGYERKLAPEWSINAEVAIPPGVGLYLINSARFMLQPRWYYRMNERIRTGKSVNNVSENYIGLSLESTFLFKLDSYYGSSQGGYSNQDIALVYGIQRRFKKRGLVDFSLRGGISIDRIRNPLSLSSNNARPITWFIETRTLIGLGFTKFSQPSSSQCEILHCFEPVRSLWKLDLNNPIRVSNDASFVRTSLGYERKLGSSPFSVQAEAGLYGRTFRYHLEPSSPLLSQGSHSNHQEFQGNLALESRYYYNLNRRIRRGKQSDNLSGNFLTLGMQREHWLGRVRNYGAGIEKGVVVEWKQRSTYNQHFTDAYLPGVCNDGYLPMAFWN